MTEEDQEYLEALESQAKELKSKNAELTGVISHSSFTGNPQEANLVQFQLNPSEILEKIEHFLKGDEIYEDEDGSTYYKEPTDDKLVLLNKYGINWFMQTLQIYINKNTFLSYYDEDRINEILGDLGDKITDFILHNYEKIGMTTQYKKSRYDLIVLNIIHSVENAYRQALMGKQREILNNNNININQSDGLGIARMPQTQVKKSFNLFSDKTWV